MKLPCKACNGFGEIEDSIDDTFGNTRKIYVPCYSCDGDGYILQECKDE